MKLVDRHQNTNPRSTSARFHKYNIKGGPSKIYQCTVVQKHYFQKSSWKICQCCFRESDFKIYQCSIPQTLYPRKLQSNLPVLGSTNIELKKLLVKFTSVRSPKHWFQESRVKFASARFNKHYFLKDLKTFTSARLPKLYLLGRSTQLNLPVINYTNNISIKVLVKFYKISSKIHYSKHYFH